MIICLETATTLCSVALCDSSGVISLRESSESRSHASVLTVYIEDLLNESGIKAGDLEAIAVSKGPGSYTGLRIGVSVAKGIAYAASIPLIGIETTLSMFHGITGDNKAGSSLDENTIFCPMLDARRMEVYYAFYDRTGKRLKDIAAEIIDEQSFLFVPEENNILFFGDGAFKCKEVIRRKNICFADEYKISAAHMWKPVYRSYGDQLFEDVAYFEPFYLKDFLTSVPRKNVFGQ
jgi:tRNA threonylcarbamoyladenosine biosynthesis protein TsaB